MEHFIRFFKLSMKDALLVRLCATISESWRCSHRPRDCYLNGLCIKENYVKVCMIVLDAQDHDSIQQIINISKSMTQTRGDLWCNVINHAKSHTLSNVDVEIDEALNVLSDAYSHSSFQETVESLKRDQGKAVPTYIDDSESLIHCFFMPVSNVSTTEISSVMRLGRFIIVLFRTNTPKTSVIWQGSKDARHFVTEMLSWGSVNLPECSITGSKRTAQWLVWMPDTMSDVLQNVTYCSRVLRILDMDLKMIQGFDTKEPSRIIQQRFGIKGYSIGVIKDLLNTVLGSNTLASFLFRENINTLEKMVMPVLLIRGFCYNYYTEEEIIMWFMDKYICQCCFINETCANKRILVMDSRAQDILGREMERSARLIKHDNGNLDHISGFELSHGEMLSRQGNHWIAFQCSDSEDALVVTCTLIHRYLRGEGIKSELDIQVAVNALARCYLYWGPTDNRIVGAIFHMYCYLLLRKKTHLMGSNLPWYDLGTFLKLILQEERVNSYMSEKMHAAVAGISILYMRLAIHRHKVNYNEVDISRTIKVITKRFSDMPSVSKSITPKRSSMKKTSM
ncbi:Tup [Guangxi orbivirus]|uniref:Tup n=1 Tax=Guangxi orbivirus TaxID=2306813 RepID=UPI000E91C483|nr:Tup [Guangxi orbivirus]AXS78002.1 Tup [Guangxi orbivirus]